MCSYTAKGKVYMRRSNGKGKCPNNSNEDEVLAQIMPTISDISIDKDLAQRICDELNKDNEHDREMCNERLKGLRIEYTKMKQRKDVMYEDRLDGSILL